MDDPISFLPSTLTAENMELSETILVDLHRLSDSLQRNRDYHHSALGMIYSCPMGSRPDNNSPGPLGVLDSS